MHWTYMYMCVHVYREREREEREEMERSGALETITLKCVRENACM